MKQKSVIFLGIIVYLLGLVYVSAPLLPSPILKDSVISDEPGDTVQNPQQKGFYTNLVRKDVLGDLQSKYSLKVFGVTIPSYRLVYRQEETKDFVRDQIPSYYLEEIVYPFRQTLFVNGWEPINSPIYSYLKTSDIPKPKFKGVSYFSKVTTNPNTTSLWARVLVWSLVLPSMYLVFFSLKRSLLKK